jgi:hypothetical protein
MIQGAAATPAAAKAAPLRNERREKARFFAMMIAPIIKSVEGPIPVRENGNGLK